MFRPSFFLALGLVTGTLVTGCAGEEIEAEAFVDGERKLTEDGAFFVELYHHEAAPRVGSNEFTLRVLFPDYNDPEGDGTGIPNARIAVDCWMPNTGYTMGTDAMAVPGDMGEYLLTHMVLDRPGVWELDIDIAVGETVTETVSYVFEIEG